ncbi:MAG: PAS domain S-box protein [Spirochaetales bacterium]|nr:PAS domain S-box protein [Spirochaetales bacterium]
MKKWIPQESHRLKKYQKILRNNDLIIEQIPVSILITDTQGKIEFANKKYFSLTGYKPHEIIGKNPRLLNSGEPGITDFTDLWDKITSDQEWSGRFLNKKKNGELLWEDAVVSPLKDTHGTITNFLAIKEDVTEKVKLDAEKTTLLQAIEHSSDSVEIIDAGGAIRYVNTAFVNNTGYSKEDAFGKKPGELFCSPDDNTSRIEEELWSHLKSGKSWRGQFRNRVKDGSFIEEEVSSTPIFDSSGKITSYIGIKRNITESLKAEEEKRLIKEQLFHAQKMESVGQLAGGVAHDFNNVLSGIMTAAHLLNTSQSSLDEDGREYVDMIIKSSMRAAGLTANLLSYSRRNKSTASNFKMSSLISEIVEIFKYTLDKKITVHVDVQIDDDMVFGDKSAFQSAVLNMGINASHAISDSGTIHIDLKNRFIDESYCNSSRFAIKPGEYCQILISDTGCGIPEENLSEIFNPFFTSKEDGKGTGLGLSSVLTTINEFQGEITVQSTPGVGSEFQMLIPCSEQTNMTNEKKEAVVTGEGVILLVDDEEFNRKLGHDILTRLGYQVLLAANGAEAVAIFIEKKNEIDLIILDLNMPVMDGKDTYIKMMEMKSDTRIMISSGYADDNKIHELKKEGLKYIIEKPYRISTLSQYIHKILSNE